MLCAYSLLIERSSRRWAYVLVDYEPGTRLSYFRVFDLQERLEELLGAKVDLVTTGGLRSELRDGILAEAIHAA
jgi:predicted nucleotidyltransferase